MNYVLRNEMMSGYGDGLFGPDDNITREELAVMLWRYAGIFVATDKKLRFNDDDKAGCFSWDALHWGQWKGGILTGYGDGRLEPTGLVTRAEIAAMLIRYMEDTPT